MLGDRVRIEPSAVGAIRIVASSIPSGFVLDEALLGQPIDAGDLRLRVRGDRTTILSCLSLEARDLLLNLLGGRHHVRVTNGELIVTTRSTDRAELRALVDSVSNLAREMTALPPGPDALLRNAKRPSGDPSQHLNAVHLLSRYPDSAQAWDLLAFARANPRLAGFTWNAIGEILGPAPAAFLATAPERDVARAVREAGTPISERIVDRLAAIGRPGEVMVCAIIEEQPNDLLSNFALGTLARIGSVAVVERLTKARSFGSFAAFEKAIQSIKDRAGAPAGGLSIAEAASQGELSEAAPTGALSKDRADE